MIFVHLCEEILRGICVVCVLSQYQFSAIKRDSHSMAWKVFCGWQFTLRFSTIFSHIPSQPEFQARLCLAFLPLLLSIPGFRKNDCCSKEVCCTKKAYRQVSTWLECVVKDKMLAQALGGASWRMKCFRVTLGFSVCQFWQHLH